MKNELDHETSSVRGGGARLRAACLAVVACALLFATLAAASDESERLYSRALVEFHADRYREALALLDRAVAADPDDAYASYYRGVTQARLGEYERAAVDLRKALDLQPGLDEARLELGVALVQDGRYEEAVSQLEAASRVEKLRGNASFFLGLARLRLDELDAAAESFAAAATAEPALAFPSEYYLGVVAYRQRRVEEARRHFQTVADGQPDSDMGHEAAQFLERLEGGEARRYHVHGGAAFQYDSNVVLAGDLDLGISDQSDGRFTIAAGGVYVPWWNDWLRLQVGYEFFQSLHFDLEDFDLQNHRPEAQLIGRWQDLRFGLLGRYDYYARGRSDFQSFLQQGTLLPWAAWEEGDFGRSEVYYRFRLRDFLDGRFEVRDGYNDAAGFRQFLYLGAPDRYVFAGYQFDREDPENDNFPPPEDPDRFAYDGHEVSFGFGWTLPAEIRADLSYAYRRERYPKNSLYVNNQVADVPGRVVTTDQGRLDKVHEVVVVLRRPIGQYLSVVASYFGDFNASNDSEFDYNRHIGSVGVEVLY